MQIPKYRLVLLVAVAGIMAACKTNVYIAKTPAEPMIDVEDPRGALTRLSPPGSGAIVVGMAFDRPTGNLYLRHIPGTLLRELDRSTGAQIRTFNAQGVTAGCGGEIPGCGLAMRWSDQHLFLDHPTGNLIAEIEKDGRLVRNITLQRPGGVIGGLEYDQERNTLYVLFRTTSAVAEVDLNGQEIRRFNLSAQVQPLSLAMDPYRNLLFIPLLNAAELGAFGLDGRLVRRHSIPPAGFAGGAAARPRR